MPEGDAVLRTARALNRGLAGQVLRRTDFRVPQLATTDLSGGTVLTTETRGKHLLTRIDHRTGEWTLHTHLKMEGSWRVLDVGRRWPKPGFQARVVLGTETTEAVGFLLGTVELLPRDQEHAAFDHLGPDILADSWDPDEALRRLLRQPGRTLFEALRDQTNLAGIGTIYAAETCFIAGVSPLRQVADATERLPAMLQRTRELMKAEWSRSRRMWVYGRRACRRCGGTVSLARVGPAGQERPAYFCTFCQR
ncbi:endonuclease-8 [Nocardioides albertanoniae]|uniref:DNA-(apurinic or apyrimidinic site) lyase n=1 Tax=Nocardioides albertanoniae TaxID=1175486 RepID=A0A543A683_9ACTN|nr:DNA-formamidopyrimidine glycosylase family protein [Nocardioides albertanoniae]TQL68067.1 endonuclease-8 [Nocardioides albertanoniae]